MIHSLGYQLIYFDNSTFKDLNQMKAMPSEEQEMILQHCLMVLRCILQEFQVSFQFMKQQRMFGQGASLASPSILQMLGTETSLLQPWARQ